MKLSDALRRFRQYANITQKQAAWAANISERNYQAYEYDQVMPNSTVLINLADHFDVSLDYLVGRSDDPARHYISPEYAPPPIPIPRRLAAKIEKLSGWEQEAVIVFIDALGGLKKAFNEADKEEVRK